MYAMFQWLACIASEAQINRMLRAGLLDRLPENLHNNNNYYYYRKLILYYIDRPLFEVQ